MAEFEERADQLTLADINDTLVSSAPFLSAKRKLLGRGAKLLVGPRGTGKTHLMRFCYVSALSDSKEPLALYTSFSRYLHLEPLLSRTPDAKKRFRAWVLAKIILSLFDVVRDFDNQGGVRDEFEIPHDEVKLREMVALLEQGNGENLYESLGQFITVDSVLSLVDDQRRAFGRSRAVLLLDDAALSLTDQYLVAFFDLFRVLKSAVIAPKASVYPGSTQYGPTFHVSHETEEVPLWLSVESPDYLSAMSGIAQRRFSSEDLASVTADVDQLFQYASFGIPRVYLRLLREFMELADAKSTQQKINRILEGQEELISAEYSSLAMKLPQFASIVDTGQKFFGALVHDLVEAQKKEPNQKVLVVGIPRGPSRTPFVERMLRFLVEVGMLYPLQSVSHGKGRQYDRFIPHLALVRRAGGFRDGRSVPFRDIAVHMAKSAAKHPLRREISSLLTQVELQGLKLDQPPCSICQTKRINESQRFCHHCGAPLAEASQFERCMRIELTSVPGLSKRVLQRLHNDTTIRTIGDVYASPSASRDLQKATYVGPYRAQNIIERVQFMVDEFLS